MNNLRESLENLHNELKNSTDIDGESVKILQELMSDIKEILDRNKEIPASANLVGSLKDTAGKFEVSHPKITSAINIVISSLTNIGV